MTPLACNRCGAPLHTGNRQLSGPFVACTHCDTVHQLDHNATRITAQKDGRVVVRNGPLPWPRNPRFAPGTITQLFVREIHHKNKNGETSTFQTMAITDQATRPLAPAFTTKEDALYVEQELEAFLNLSNVPVRGETR